ncbi:hypothetical protein NCS52_01593800 [Fusarium sp. LHS14.1]|nr:hypothetical protein NCS52_01593800 [Fusarium sp. LHS14.1]
MNAQDQADNLYASSIGPIPSLNDFDSTNRTVRERPEDLNQHDLDLRKKQEEPLPSKSGEEPSSASLRPKVWLKGEPSSQASLCPKVDQSWVGTRPIAETNSDADAKSFPCQAELTPKSGRTLERMCGVPSLVFCYDPSTRFLTGEAYMPSNQPTPDWNRILDTI